MTDLVEFLRARLDEDHRVAEAAVDHLSAQMSYVEVYIQQATDHIDRFTPARVLAEVAAKRRLIDQIVPKVEAYWRAVNSEWGCEYDDPDGDDVLKILALPYASHSEYDESWRP